MLLILRNNFIPKQNFQQIIYGKIRRRTPLSEDLRIKINEKKRLKSKKMVQCKRLENQIQFQGSIHNSWNKRCEENDQGQEKKTMMNKKSKAILQRLY